MSKELRCGDRVKFTKGNEVITANIFSAIGGGRGTSLVGYVVEWWDDDEKYFLEEVLDLSKIKAFPVK
jgi:hypothetical protein